MTSTKSKLIANYILYTLLIALCGLPGRALSQAQPKADSAKSSPPAQKTFANPQQAADFLIAAADQFDVPSLLQLFGPGGEDFVATADPVADKRVSVAFAAKADEKKSVQIDPKNPNRAILVVGNEEWPFPIPIVKRNGKWIFDTKAGHQEVLARRIGANELDAITICRGYVEAQLEYASQVHDNSVVFQYAQKVISTPGKHDGLAWQNADGNWEGPVGEAVAKALADGYAEKKPFHGYYFKLLEGQGPAARLGTLIWARIRPRLLRRWNAIIRTRHGIAPTMTGRRAKARTKMFTSTPDFVSPRTFRSRRRAISLRMISWH